MNDQDILMMDAAIEAYRDGSLSQDQAQRLVTALRSDRAVQLHELLQFTTLLSQAFITADDVVRSVNERIDAEQSASSMVHAVRQALPPARRKRAPATFPMRRWALASAILIAMCLAITATIFDHRSLPPTICYLSHDGDAPIIRRNQLIASRMAQQKDLPLYALDQLITTSPVTLTWPDGSRVLIAAHSELRIQPHDNDALFIKTGSLQAHIVAQLAHKPFRISTTNAVIQVLGTSFEIHSTEQHTTCNLQHGTVRMERRRDHHQLILQANQTATVADDREFIAQNISAPPVISPAERPWSPLFADTGLTGWTPQYGTWTQRDHIVYGIDADKNGKIRLLSAQPFLDLELKCQLQISGSEFAELQVGDYNWFAEIPAQADQWIDIHLLQVGKTLTVTADGKPLPILPGAGLAMRPGSLGFYVMPGGSIAIRQAQFRLPVSP